jgi:hypothetical protein
MTLLMDEPLLLDENDVSVPCEVGDARGQCENPARWIGLWTCGDHTFVCAEHHAGVARMYQGRMCTCHTCGLNSELIRWERM